MNRLLLCTDDRLVKALTNKACKAGLLKTQVLLLYPEKYPLQVTPVPPSLERVMDDNVTNFGVKTSTQEIVLPFFCISYVV